VEPQIARNALEVAAESQMTFPWFIAGASLIVALVAWSQARRTAKRLAQLSEMYWELKYQQGELRLRVQRMAGEAPAPTSQPGPPGQPGEAFVPLESLVPRRAEVRGEDPAKR
jgi:hypothetical protein